jgi:hypothetical protein
MKLVGRENSLSPRLITCRLDTQSDQTNLSDFSHRIHLSVETLGYTSMVLDEDLSTATTESIVWPFVSSSEIQA